MIMKKFLKWLLCKNNIHLTKIKLNLDKTWHECIVCKKQKEFTDYEYFNTSWNDIRKNTIKWRFYNE
jgi:hypothetical protein